MSIFTKNKKSRIPHSKFDLSHERKFSMNMGKLVPIYLQEVLPGDKISINTESMIRFAPMVAPTMHRINSYVHYFYVRNNLLWDGFEKFITGDENTTIPTQRLGEVTEGSLADYMGIPTGEYSEVPKDINILPFRAYHLIWNEFYRDQNLQEERDITASVDMDNLSQRAWQKDYFTSALPWPQKGGEVSLPVISTPHYKSPAEGKGYVQTPTGNLSFKIPQGGAGFSNVFEDSNGQPIDIENISSIEGGIAINDLRTATRLQRWLEKNAVSGSRYVEHLLKHWGITSSDARRNRPEYIGGGKSPVVMSEVLNTSASETTLQGELPQGNMSGHGINVGNTNKASKFCEEHGYIIGIMSVMPDTAYHQGINKMWTRETNLDFYTPEFAQLGEQPVLNQELKYEDSTTNDNEGTFGYQSIWAEYKYAQSSIHGQFRTSLDHFHLSRKFLNLPALNEDFIKADPDTRIFAIDDPDIDHLWVQLYNRVIASRPMPYYNEPTL